jgi:hypothetical protein
MSEVKNEGLEVVAWAQGNLTDIFHYDRCAVICKDGGADNASSYTLALCRHSEALAGYAARDARIAELEHRCGMYGLELTNEVERRIQATEEAKRLRAELAALKGRSTRDCNGCAGTGWRLSGDECSQCSATGKLYAAPAHSEKYTYSSRQETECAGCRVRKHTPLRVDEMGGYVCLTCIDKKLTEFYDAPAPAVVTVQLVIGSTYESSRGFGRLLYMGETQDIDGWLPTFRMTNGTKKFYGHDELPSAIKEFAAIAPVPAVVMPERRTKADYSCYIGEFANEAAAIHNAALDLVARLNEVQS